MRSKALQSEQHLSRWTIRAVLNGYQRYERNQKTLLLQASNYLVIPSGIAYQNSIEAPVPVEALVISFHPGQVAHILANQQHSTSALIDNPDMEKDGQSLPSFWDSSYLRTTAENRLFQRYRQLILSGQGTEGQLEELNYLLLECILNQHQQSLRSAATIPAKNTAVRQELLRRLRYARDFIEAHFDQVLSLADIAREAQLSTYYFLRLFRTVYQQTPFQFLTEVRLRKAKYLLASSSLSIRDIAWQVGFEDQSAFARWFKNQSGQTPSLCRPK